jgi:hypothetical protein
MNAVRAAPAANRYDELIKAAVQRVLIDRMMALVEASPMPQVRSATAFRLQQFANVLAAATTGLTTNPTADDIKRFLARPMTETPRAPAPPPGAPIGEPAMDWLRRDVCSQDERY